MVDGDDYTANYVSKSLKLLYDFKELGCYNSKDNKIRKVEG